MLEHLVHQHNLPPSWNLEEVRFTLDNIMYKFRSEKGFALQKSFRSWLSMSVEGSGIFKRRWIGVERGGFTGDRSRSPGQGWLVWLPLLEGSETPDAGIDDGGMEGRRSSVLTFRC